MRKFEHDRGNVEDCEIYVTKRDMTQEIEITQHRMENQTGTFEVSLAKTKQPGYVAVMSSGRGGNPSRHIQLITRIAQSGCLVIAPHFDMLSAGVPTAKELNERICHLEQALDRFSPSNLEVVGVGHSIGTVVLLAMAGGKPRTLDGDFVSSGSKYVLTRLALMSPPADFFIETTSLTQVRSNIRVWVGKNDSITPPTQARLLVDRLPLPTSIEIDTEADHFTYMDKRPPHSVETHSDAINFKMALARDVANFLTTSSTSSP